MEMAGEAERGERDLLQIEGVEGDVEAAAAQLIVHGDHGAARRARRLAAGPIHLAHLPFQCQPDVRRYPKDIPGRSTRPRRTRSPECECEESSVMLKRKQ